MNIAAKWYEDQQEGLGVRFLNSIQDTVNRIQINSKIYPIVQSDISRSLVKIFTYSAVFKETENTIIIFAVMHNRRKPDYWEERNKSVSENV